MSGKAETMTEYAARLGYTWDEWLALSLTERAEAADRHAGITRTSRERADRAVWDVPAGPDRLAAFHAALRNR